MIYVFGTVCLDRIRHISALPAKGQYVEVDSETIALGGEAANTAAHLRRWHASYQLAGNALGSDADGHILAGLLAEHGLDYEAHPVPVESTPVCDVYVTPDGERTMYGRGFVSMRARPQPAFPDGSSGWFTMDANMPEPADRYIQAAKAAGLRVYLMDLEPSTALLGLGAYWQSSTRWTGGRGDAEACKTLVAKTAQDSGATAILTDSARGFFVAAPGSPVRSYPIFPREVEIDPTGAGDLFRAGMLFGLDQNWPLAEALRYAAAAAALGAGAVGAAEGPSVDQVKALISAHPDVAGMFE